MRLSDLTNAAVSAALREFSELGRAAFLKRYGFGPARDYFVRDQATGGLADSKAIVGAAHGYQFPELGPLPSSAFSGGDATVASTLIKLGFEIVRAGDGPSGQWSRHEVNLIVADHLQMLTLELSGQSFNKTEHRRKLKALLVNRSDGSIEFKHCNISAVLIELGFPYVRGYQPRSNYQALLSEVVAEQVQQLTILDRAALAAVEQPAIAPTASDFSKIKVDAPARQLRTGESNAPQSFRAVKRDYLQRETINRSLGLAGEEFVIQFERWRLAQFGAHQLAEQVKHVSVEEGDGLGYDVLSFDTDGQQRFIEVKTTTFGKETPFFVSKGELALSRQAEQSFHLYRLYEFRKDPRLFDLPGRLDQHCLLDPISFRASFA